MNGWGSDWWYKDYEWDREKGRIERDENREATLKLWRANRDLGWDYSDDQFVGVCD